jgi:predicted transcriptional regulator YdeE
MTNYRLIQKPAFIVLGKVTWISGQDNALFGQFWTRSRKRCLFETFELLRGRQTGHQTNSSVLGISRVEKDPAERSFYYMIAVEVPVGCPDYG